MSDWWQWLAFGVMLFGAAFILLAVFCIIKGELRIQKENKNDQHTD